jgi:predicted O-methyltransferase YrrM
MIKDLMTDIERALPADGWCTLERAQTLASLITGLRPKLVLEIGVWTGGSAIPMLLALRWNARHPEFKDRVGRFIAIDPWRAAASLVGQTGPNAAWWGSTDHEAAYRTFVGRVQQYELTELCTIQRAASDEVTPPNEIDMLSIDGNHGEQAIRDVDRFASRVTVGGILALDDVDWTDPATGVHDVRAAHGRAIAMGFQELYRLGSGVVMQRVGTGVMISDGRECRG